MKLGPPMTLSPQYCTIPKLLEVSENVAEFGLGGVSVTFEQDVRLTLID
jgi:hypothetical protein